MCQNKMRENTITRNLPILLIASGVIFWGMACNRKHGPTTTAQTNRGSTQPTTRSREPVKVGETVFASIQEFVDSLPERCATVGPAPDERDKIERNLEALEKANPDWQKTGTITVRVYFHIITNADRTEGNVSNNAAQSQIDVLNAAFAGSGGSTPTPFRFVLADADIDRTANDDWFNMEYRTIPTYVERQAKAALNKGDKSSLNVYTVRLANKAFGWGRYPWQLADKVDGIVIRYSTLPGGASTYYNEGDTAVHETGHWLGLYHTFEYGCDPGDYVDDTNAEASAARYCPVDWDTCPAAPGLDPVENYMDFTWDSCMYKFTPGQVVRMVGKYQQYRL